MHYLVSVIDTTSGPTGEGSATDEEQAAIAIYNDGLQRDGSWVFAGGLAAPEMATVIDHRGDSAVVTDGPFVETKEYLSGFWVIEAPDLDVALKIAAGASKACRRKVEVRPFLGVA